MWTCALGVMESWTAPTPPMNISVKRKVCDVHKFPVLYFCSVGKDSMPLLTGATRAETIYALENDCLVSSEMNCKFLVLSKIIFNICDAQFLPAEDSREV